MAFLDTAHPLRPKFNLGGQVSRYSSNPQIGNLSVEEEESENHFNVMSSSRTGSASLHNNSRSLNPELLIREFTQDEQGRLDSLEATDSPSACFQSAFAREVVQNTRRSSSILDTNTNSKSGPAPVVVPVAAPVEHNSMNSYNSGHTRNPKRSLPTSKYRSQFAAKYHQGGQDDDSDSTCEEMHRQRNKRTSSSSSSFPKEQGAPGAASSIVQQAPVQYKEDDENLWMTATQFSQLLDKQEALENLGYAKLHKQKSLSIVNNTPPPPSSGTIISSSKSYLDSEALLPLAKMKQTCDELGFTVSDKEWVQIRNMLENSTENLASAAEDQNLMMVKSEDFFSALHTIMTNKQKNRNGISEAGSNLKHQSNSMKSDSGGEMESCRSSDSELERELHEKEKEILERDRELTNCYRTLAERDTDLIKVRLECQRLLEDNRQLRSQLNDLKTLGFSGGNNSKRQIEMEKEIENLKWHLSIMENSRKSYESATQQLVSFLEHVTTMLQATSPSQRKLFEATKAQVLKTTGKNYKHRFSLGHGSNSSQLGDSIFRAESMPGLNMRGSMLSLSTNGGGDNMSVSSSTMTMPRRFSNSSSASSRNQHRNVHRSQSTHSKRSPMPSLQESSDYVNTDVIEDFIKSESAGDESSSISSPERPKSVAEISQKENVCNITIKAEESKTVSSKPKRSASSVSTTKLPAKRSDKASRLLGIDEHQIANAANTGIDSGRFSMPGNSLSPALNNGKSTPQIKTEDQTPQSILLKVDDKEKFKSLGDLHMEKGLPTVLVNHNGEPDEESKKALLASCRKMLSRTKKMFARDHKTLEITPSKVSSTKSRSSLPGGQKQTLQLISHTTFPGLPTYPVLAASHSSPWNC